MDWLKEKLQQKCRVKNKFEKIWQRHKRHYPSTLTLITRVSVEIREKLNDRRLDPLTICQQIHGHVSANLSESESTTEENRLLLLEAVDIMAAKDVKNARSFFRDLLTLLFGISKIVDREVYLFDNSKVDGPVEFDDECRAKMRYTLGNIAGWKLTTCEPWIGRLRPAAPPAEFYLDLPLRRVNSPASTHMMAEALFRLQDPEVILDLLRHGASPSCVYLWPVVVMMDLKLVMHGSVQSGAAGTAGAVPPEDAAILTKSREGRMIEYFCRARRNIYLNPIRATEAGSARMPPGVNYEDVLLIPNQMTFLVPEDLHKRPARLQQICRLVIRETLFESDCLPTGIYQLPIPAILHRYIDLLL